jgi:hypothetical protein
MSVASREAETPAHTLVWSQRSPNTTLKIVGTCVPLNSRCLAQKTPLSYLLPFSF